MIDHASSISKTPAEATAGEPPCQQISSNAEELRSEATQSEVDSIRQKQLLSIIDLLRYAEAEILELHIETSAVLVGAAITDLAQDLE